MQNVSDVWTLPVLPEKFINIIPDQKQQRTFQINVDSECVHIHISYFYLKPNENGICQQKYLKRSSSSKVCFVCRTLSHSIIFIKLYTNSKSSLSFSITYDVSSIDTDTGIPYAAVILIGLYILIIFEVNHV